MTTTTEKKFTFEENFEIRSCDHGGFVLRQGKLYEDVNWYEKAFTNLNDMVGFLVDQKVLFEGGMGTTPGHTPGFIPQSGAIVEAHGK